MHPNSPFRAQKTKTKFWERAQPPPQTPTPVERKRPLPTLQPLGVSILAPTPNLILAGFLLFVLIVFVSHVMTELGRNVTCEESTVSSLQR